MPDGRFPAVPPDPRPALPRGLAPTELPWSDGGERVEVAYRLAGIDAGRLAAPIEADATGGELAAFLADGYLPRPAQFSEEEVAAFGDAVDRLAELELAEPDVRAIPGNGYYVADLMAKDPVFHVLLRHAELTGIARALLGPQVSVRTDARVAFAETAGVALEWHIHMPVIPDPMPPLFSYPHQVHCLIYLDDITPDEGALQLLPGSHRTATLTRAELAAQPGILEFRPQAGDCMVLHGNLWHRTEPSSAAAGRRRLLIHGYGPAWLKGDRRPAPGQLAPAEGVPTLLDELRAGRDEEIVELLDGFTW